MILFGQDNRILGRKGAERKKETERTRAHRCSHVVNKSK